MIVVGFLGALDDSGKLALEIARRAADTGVRVEMVGVAAPDAAGDARLVELASAGIGHATVVRSGAIGLDAADLELALRYLPDVHAIVLVAPGASLIVPAAAASGWSGAGLVIVGGSDDGPDGASGAASATDSGANPSDASRRAAPAVNVAPAVDSAPALNAAPQAIVLDPPRVDSEGTFAGLVATLAARLDAGDNPATAWKSTVDTLAVDRIGS